MPIILENVSFSYSRKTPLETPALRNINLRIEKGEFVGILGEKGAGKSTLAKLFNGLLKPETGKILVDGLDPSSKEAKRRIGMVFQQAADQLFCKTVYQEIAFGPLNFGCSKKETEERVYEAIEAVSLDQTILTRDPFSLSGGEMQRVALASALALRPDYLVLDEPITGLDPAGKKEILEALKKIKERGTAVITVTHNLKGFFPLLETIVLMKEGKIVFQGSRESYLEKGCIPLPPIASMMKELRARGLPVNPAAFTVEDALEEILKLKSAFEKENNGN
ncbi:MAG: ATP-binding cassette domain-containing protein [Methanosarcina thermophila]|jgi:energy-coupling factor transport system ATP-binding protein|uniref:Energy-coupling factor transport system ATP-binding protein n=3 Tax=Methanosarcina thermophila TaxID=2210 RepID=A0A1I6X5I8_METTE|nr:ATP-binding cassette domain-containing protein [Methanosarcina thermophila]ALK04688.1 MAG: ABC transporter ATP-binding protein [Methanosarcina sp. 795]AKB13378.1 ATPase component BioM of energizing module of biotin ECF transporter [Methanosarcina thermophila TM-1]AKB15987.1 ATPase component BioM of energizing module of biotin ECF transporter [Methanosarcina thermophila CHTI-55]NLU58004.1 energy-coupling factor transporter ATPase [Methanosarcina thermophila]SFT33124.1 energy-coupling factor 